MCSMFYLQNATDSLTKQDRLHTKSYLVPHILTKVDRPAMTVSLKANVLILIHNHVAFAATMPPIKKLTPISKNYLTKIAAEYLLPKQVIYSSK